MSAFQIRNIAPVGSLLKGAKPHPKRLELGRNPRVENPSYLALIRKLPCLKCGLEDHSEAAHVRMNCAALGKREGMSRKPDDKYALPLCASCHRLDADSQHQVGELIFWDSLGISPLPLCVSLHKASPDIVAMRAVVMRAVSERR